MPVIPPDLQDRLLRLFLEPRCDIAQVADATKLSLLQLVAWFSLPETQAALAAIRDMAKARAEILADLKLHAAVENLNRVNEQLARLEFEPDAPAVLVLRHAETARRNASAMQRLGTPRALAARARTLAPAAAAPADMTEPSQPSPAQPAAVNDQTGQPALAGSPAVITNGPVAQPLEPSIIAKARDEPRLATAA